MSCIMHVKVDTTSREDSRMIAVSLSTHVALYRRVNLTGADLLEDKSTQSRDHVSPSSVLRVAYV